MLDRDRDRGIRLRSITDHWSERDDNGGHDERCGPEHANVESAHY